MMTTTAVVVVVVVVKSCFRIWMNVLVSTS